MPENGSDVWRTSPLYTASEAAHLAHVSVPTIKRWLFGYDTGSNRMPPVFGGADPAPMVSFLQLAEIVVASSFRQRRINLQVVRQAHARAKAETGLEYPFATLRFESIGGHVLRLYDLEHGTSLAVPSPDASFEPLDAPGMFTLPHIVVETMESFDYERDLAARWYPLTKTTPLIVVDPRYSAGVPTIAGRRVTTEAVIKRFRAGHSIRLIARDLKLKMDQVETVLRYAEQIAA